ncbi:MAG: transcription termination/antitermination protein NusA [Myxococcales bacterium]|nr:transcription termination/antitermination protein NusA [Myxococcales bacterium]
MATRKTTAAAQPAAPAEPSLGVTIDKVAKDKGIDRAVFVDAIRTAILSAARKLLGPTRELVARFNEKTGEVDLFQYMTIVDVVTNDETEISFEDARRVGLEAEAGEQLAFPVFYRPEDEKKAAEQEKRYGDMLKLQSVRKGFGRIAAQAAKQVIIQRLRDAERENVFNEFRDRKGELITGVVRRFERGHDIVVDLNGKTEAILRSREQVMRENYRPGERIVAYLKDIDREARGPQVILSRSDVGLLVKLFEQEVPEIYEGIVRIVAAAREPGVRSKIAVSSTQREVDPVGACVGVKGARVQAVVQELRGERIDIVPFDPDPARFVCNAIAPAEVTRVTINEGNRSMELVVPDDKLSLAIGRKGQNVRLASQLTNWKLDIIAESKFLQTEKDAVDALSTIEGVNAAVAQSLYKLGFRAVDDLADASVEELQTVQILGGAEGAARMKNAALAALESDRQRRVREAVQGSEPVSDRQRLALVRGVTEPVLKALDDAGVRSVEQLRDGSVEALARETGLPARKLRALMESAAHFIDNDGKAIDEARANRG